MLNAWKRDASVEELIDLTATPVDDVPQVREVLGRFIDAINELESANREVKRLNRVMSHQDQRADIVEVAQAKVLYPAAVDRLDMAEAVKVKLARELARVRDVWRQRIGEARIAARKPLLRDLLDRLEACVPLAERLSVYDTETTRLCGQQAETPFPQLLRSWNGTENQVDYQRRHCAEW